jgi:HK97 family phage major capsid protein
MTIPQEAIEAVSRMSNGELAEFLRGVADRKNAGTGSLSSSGRSLYSNPPGGFAIGGSPKTPGDQFRESGQHQAWLTKFPSGAPTMPMAAQTDPLEVEGGMRALITASDTVAGDLVAPDRRGLLEPGLTRPLRVRDLVQVQTTQSDEVTYTLEASRVTAAAAVTEAAQLAHSGDVTATKPEGGLTFDIATALVRQFAIWVPATRRILSDANGLAQYINSYLSDDLSLEVEDQIVSGTGAPGFTGIYNTTGTQTAGPPAGGVNEIDLIREAFRLIQVNARTTATAVLANPADVARWDTTKINATSNEYLLRDPGSGTSVPNLWGVPVVESEAATAGIALVGDFRRAILFDREQTSIAVGTANEDFIRNIVRVLAESRAAFVVTRPSAFVEVDLLV